MSDAPQLDQKVLLISHGQGLSSVDRKALEAVGFVVVRVKNPNLVRFITKDEPPMTATDMLRAAVVGLLKSGTWSDSPKARAWDALVKLVGAAPPETGK